MTSNIYNFTKNQQDFSAIPDEAEKVAEYNDLSPKESMRLRLLAEELICMMPNLVSYGGGKFWIESSGRNYELHLEVKAKIPELIDQEKLLSVSSDGKNAAAKGIIGKICAAIDGMMKVSNALPVDSSMNIYGMTAYGDYSDWSLCLYRDMLSQEYNGERRDEFAEDWDELEKSIIANIADDVKVWIRGDKIEVTVFKRFK